MDPASIIGVTAAALQFLSFTTKVALGAHRATDNILSKDAGKEAQRFGNFARALDRQLQDETQWGDQHDIQDADAAETTLRRLCIECRDQANELRDASLKLQRKIDRNPVHSFREELKNTFGVGKINEMRQRAAKNQDQLMTISVICIWNAMNRRETALEDVRARVMELREVSARPAGRESDHSRPGLIPNGLSDAATASKESEHTAEHDELPESVPPNLRRAMDAMKHAFFRNWKSPSSAEVSSSEEVLRAQQPSHRHLARQVAASLDYTERDRRPRMIKDHHQGTTEWLWREPPTIEDAPAWSSLPEWLESNGQRTYWITGKPGSGKSTLMRAIEQDPRTRKHLQIWALDRPLHIWSFYAWSPGRDIEKSISGMLRSIVFQVLQIAPELVPVALPRRWAFATTFGEDPSLYPRAAEQEDIEHLHRILPFLFSECDARMRALVLVDGLDEFGEPPQKLVDTLGELFESSAMKMCVASRPWTQFSDHFSRNPRLVIHKFTGPDVELYVRGRLESCVASQERPQEAEWLARRVVDAAQGVFQWVIVVTSFLVEWIGSGSPLEELSRIIDTLPEELDELYTSIWERMTEKQQVQAEELFILRHANANGELGHETLWCVLERDAKGKNLEILQDTAQYVTTVRKIVERYVSGRTLCLMEVTPLGTIDYMHRSTAEWAKTRLGGGSQGLRDRLIWAHCAIIKGVCLLSQYFPNHAVDQRGRTFSGLLVSLRELSIKAVEGSVLPPDFNDTSIVHWLRHLQTALQSWNFKIEGSLALVGGTSDKLGEFRSVDGRKEITEFTKLIASYSMYAPFVCDRIPQMGKRARQALFSYCLYSWAQFDFTYTRDNLDLPVLTLTLPFQTMDTNEIDGLDSKEAARLSLLKSVISAGLQPSRISHENYDSIQVHGCTWKEAISAISPSPEDKHLLPYDSYYSQVAKLLREQDSESGFAKRFLRWSRSRGGKAKSSMSMA